MEGKDSSNVSKYYNNFNILSPVEQLVSQIGNDELNERDYEIIAYIVYESFSFYELLELDALSVHDSRLKYILEEYPPNWNYASVEDVIKDLDEYEGKLNLSLYIFFLLKAKKKFISKSPNTSSIEKCLNKILFNINNRIKERLIILECDMKDFYSYKDSFGLFLIYEKEEALKRFSSFISRYYQLPTFELMQLKFYTLFDHVFNIIGDEFIPYLNTRNFDNISTLNNENDLFATKDEIRKIIEIPLEFDKDVLGLLNKKHILNKELDFMDFDTFKFHVHNFFKPYIKDSRNVEVFMDHITSYDTKYDFFTLELARREIILSFKDEEVLVNFLALIYELDENKFISGCKSKFIEILDLYIPDNIIRKSKIKVHLMTTVHPKLQKEDDEKLFVLKVARDKMSNLIYGNN